LDAHPDLASLVYVAATTGARRGELPGLGWSDVDLDVATLTIVRSVSDAGRIVAIKDTKTHQARRLALDDSTVKVLLNHRRLAEERAPAAGVGLASSAATFWGQTPAPSGPSEGSVTVERESDCMRTQPVSATPLWAWSLAIVE
jgi:integrase